MWNKEPDPRESQTEDREHAALPVNYALTWPEALELPCYLKKKRL